MPQIALPIEFFQKERRQAYSDWRAAFWRELLANSIDAGATEIKITIEPTAVVFDDNGCGMDLPVAENVYLSIGRSTKDGKGGVGGFGRARILTCFGMDRYSLRSRNYRIEGVGAEYTIQHGVTGRHGLALEVSSTEFPSVLTNRTYLERALNESYLPGVKFWINGEEFYPDRLRSPDDAQPFGPGGAYGSVGSMSDNSPYIGRCIVRVNGLSMFNRATQLTRVGVVVDLTPEMSRELLNANRDGGKPQLDKEIEAVVRALNSDPEAVQRKGWDIHRVEPGSHGARISERTKDWLQRKLGLVPPPKREKSIWDEDLATVTGSGYAEGPGRATLRGMSWEDPDKIEKLERMFEGHTRGWFLTTSKQALATEAARWKQENWSRLPLRDIQLILAWDAACEYSTRLLADVLDQNVEGWTTGLVFSSLMANCVYANGTRFLNLNPVIFRDAVGKLSADAARRYMLSIALHEVAHLITSQHDEQFARTLTSLMCVVDQGAGTQFIRAAERRIKQ